MRTAKAKLARCRYCVVGDEFRPMTQRDGGFICANCGHIAKPGDKDFKCFCLECSNLRALEAGMRHSRKRKR